MEKSESKWKKWIKNNYQRFCSVSTMHGYTELHSANTWLFKWFWIIIIVGSIAITGYQVNQAVFQYLYQSSFTNIAPATQDEVIYPPVKICLPHWLMWVNFTKVVKEKYFSINATQYSLSYLTDIYIYKEFDIKKARKEFLDGFAKYNFTDLFDYYAHIARTPEQFIQFEPPASHADFAWYVLEMFTVDWSNIQPENPNLCYTINSSSIKAHINEGYKKLSPKRHTKSSLHLYLKQQTIAYLATEIWRTIPLVKYVEMWQDETSFVVKKGDEYSKLPYMLFLDGFSDEYSIVSSDDDIVKFKVKASANKWQRTTVNPCEEDKFIASNQTCQEKCKRDSYVEDDKEKKFDYFRDDCSMLLQSFNRTNKKMLQNLCRNLFLRDYGDNNWLWASFEDPPGNYYSAEWLQSLTERKKMMENSLAECLLNCASKTFCENWKFEISKTLTSRILIPSTFNTGVYDEPYPQIFIEYQDISQILVFTETDSQTWENFVSNVGGLLGIWTGASILSFIQVFYLCCCADIDETCSPKSSTQQKASETTTGQKNTIPQETIFVKKPTYIA